MPKSKVVLKHPTIVEKDLTADNVWGWANQEDFEIEVEKTQPSKEYLNTLIHEMIHCMLPNLAEKSVVKMANIMTDEIWRKRFRRLSK